MKFIIVASWFDKVIIQENVWAFNPYNLLT